MTSLVRIRPESNMQELLMKSWQVQEAKARLSDLIKSAQHEPQDITLHGKSVAVVVSRADFDRMQASKESLVSFMQRSPLMGLKGFKLEREQTLTREVEL